MKVISSKDIKQIRKAGKSVTRIGEGKQTKPKTPVPESNKKEEDKSAKLLALLLKLVSKEFPVPVANVIVQPSAVTFPKPARISKLTILRDGQGLIKDIVPVYKNK